VRRLLGALFCPDLKNFFLSAERPEGEARSDGINIYGQYQECLEVSDRSIFIINRNELDSLFYFYTSVYFTIKYLFHITNIIILFKIFSK
jgi:hypothetical protein